MSTHVATQYVILIFSLFNPLSHVDANLSRHNEGHHHAIAGTNHVHGGPSASGTARFHPYAAVSSPTTRSRPFFDGTSAAGIPLVREPQSNENEEPAPVPIAGLQSLGIPQGVPSSTPQESAEREANDVGVNAVLDESKLLIVLRPFQPTSLLW